ncbi:Spt20 family-domain-containing protein [Amanita rubescens]|nr:Spt20 family-domain-containing protein [Amanita rubescens]
MAGHNKSRFVQDLLQRTEGKPPSFTVNLYPDYWSLNNGARFHYHIPMASLLDDIRAQRIPVDFLEIFDSARVPFYDGCMIVQILDYRPQNHKDPVLERAEQTRVVLHPSSESLWADICSLNQRYGTKWTDMDALEVEARVLLATSSPLCLDPDPHLTRMTNHIMRATVLPIPAPLKRKAAAMEHEDDENDKARKIKIMQHMATRPNRTTPRYFIFATALFHFSRDVQFPTIRCHSAGKTK